jgi:hypothetical protein
MGVKPSVNTVTTLPLSTTQHPQLSTGTEPSVGAADMQTPPDCVQGLQQSVGEPAGIYDVEPPSGTSTDASNVPMYETNNTSFSAVGSTADQPVATSASHVDRDQPAQSEAPSSGQVSHSPSGKKKAPGILRPGAANTPRYIITCAR